MNSRDTGSPHLVKALHKQCGRPSPRRSWKRRLFKPVGRRDPGDGCSEAELNADSCRRQMDEERGKRAKHIAVPEAEIHMNILTNARWELYSHMKPTNANHGLFSRLKSGRRFCCGNNQIHKQLFPPGVT
ncbi:hypothetical protein OJAV_G00196130 [Oryzias javanicus]|uniref:Uncharacterized protein n=1 Tax=Oryzias javanicus TaxID=123683 RepID=A0A437C7V1_ORYJA|nr:hypothetical protein OJAV_G00196130 [Oryzias javanicus]